MNERALLTIALISSVVGLAGLIIIGEQPEELVLDEFEMKVVRTEQKRDGVNVVLAEEHSVLLPGDVFLETGDSVVVSGERGCSMVIESVRAKWKESIASTTPRAKARGA